MTFNLSATFLCGGLLRRFHQPQPRPPPPAKIACLNVLYPAHRYVGARRHGNSIRTSSDAATPTHNTVTGRILRNVPRHRALPKQQSFIYSEAPYVVPTEKRRRKRGARIKQHTTISKRRCHLLLVIKLFRCQWSHKLPAAHR